MWDILRPGDILLTDSLLSNWTEILNLLDVVQQARVQLRNEDDLESRMMIAVLVFDIGEIDKFPQHTFPAPITSEPYESVLLISIETLDRVSKTLLRILVRYRRNGIINLRRPLFFFERHQNRFLIWSRKFELLDDHFA